MIVIRALPPSMISSMQRWSLSWGRRFRLLCVVDDFSRECLALVVDTSLSGLRVSRELDRLSALGARLAIPDVKPDCFV